MIHASVGSKLFVDDVLLRVQQLVIAVLHFNEVQFLSDAAACNLRACLNSQCRTYVDLRVSVVSDFDFRAFDVDLVRLLLLSRVANSVDLFERRHDSFL